MGITLSFEALTYCNAEDELTSSDIITYAITGAKVTKSFVCKAHNSFTNDMYEKKFVDDLNFFRNHLGFSTREGKPIQYIADIYVDGTEMHNVKISNRESLYAPKSVVAGFDDNGNKVLMAPMEKLEGISKGKATTVDISDVTLHKTITADSFLGFHALHSIAKIAYEWYCYVNNIEEYTEECNEIVDYILGKVDGDFVDVIIERNYYYAIDQMSEVGTNSLFQYDDIDGYRYIVFDFWKTVAYRVRICKSPNNNACDATEVDMAAFASYCQSYARWKEAQEHITSGGSTFETDKGYQQQTPWVGIANTNQKLMLQTASEFGLTPSSRSRIIAGNSKAKEPEDEMEALLGGDS